MHQLAPRYYDKVDVMSIEMCVVRLLMQAVVSKTVPSLKEPLGAVSWPCSFVGYMQNTH